jgi:sugar phosphate permease
MNANIRWIGGSIGGAVMARFITRAVFHEPGYTHGFMALAAAYAIAAAVAVLTPGRSRPDIEERFIAGLACQDVTLSTY